jgi:aminoglycoside 3-N-acetyltransferase
MVRSTKDGDFPGSALIDRPAPTSKRSAVTALLPAGLKEFIKAVLRSGSMRWLTNALQWRADRRYKKGKRPHSAAQIRQALDALPLPDGSVVLIHSSMSRLGYLEGGAEALVAALRDVLVRGRNGTVAVPTYSMTGGMADTLRAGALFDVRTTPSGTGRITELLRRQADARRSLHPTHSVAAIGPLASWLVEGHHLDPRSFGPLSPFGRLVEADGFVLGLGVDLGPVTFYHVIEDLGGFPVDVYTSDSPLVAHCIDERGSRVNFPVMAHDPSASVTRIDRPNGAAIRTYITTVLENSAGLAWFRIGDGRMWLVSARRFYDCLVLLRDRGITIYATAEQVASLPPPAAILPAVAAG